MEYCIRDPRIFITCLLFASHLSAFIAHKELGPSMVANETAPLTIQKGINGLDKVVLHNARGSSAEVYLYGAHVISWKNEHGEDLLFLSNKATFEPPKSIRGGIYLCFPQYSNTGPLPSHGFARNRFWSIEPSPPPFSFPFPSNSSNEESHVDLILKSTEEDMKIWPHRFEYRIRVTLGYAGDLTLTSRVRNTDMVGKSFNFTFAYHPNFLVSDISKVSVEGLENLNYLDQTQNRTRFPGQKNAITFESQVDNVYLSTPKTSVILDHGNNRTFVVRKDGLPDTVVWNPAEARARTIVDLGDGQYRIFVAVEPAAMEKPVTLNSGEEWTGIMKLSAVPSSCNSGKLDP